MKAPRSRSVLHSYEDMRDICRLGSLGARPASIRLVIGGNEGDDGRIGRILREYLGHSARHGRRPGVANAEATPRHRQELTLSFLTYSLIAPWCQTDAQRVYLAYETYRFMGMSLGNADSLFSVEHTVTYAQGLAAQNLKLIACRECSAPGVVESFRLERHFVCDACAVSADKKAASDGATSVPAPGR